MVQGTGSGVGKSFLAAGLCRILSDRGLKVAPFKAQNMALNSYVTAGGGEIGRAQALQAEAARMEPNTDVNPILLKTQSDSGCQVIVNGKVHASMSAREYYRYRDTAWEAVTSAYDRLARDYEVVVLEGAGSPAEINLSSVDIVNMAMAHHAKSPVILVGDIDEGGVFASLYGTMALLDGSASLVKGFIINKFRGDLSILEPGLEMIREKTGVPVLGVLPYLGDLGLHEEDGIPRERLSTLNASENRVRIAVVRLKSISNFTDFDPFLYESDVTVYYTSSPSELENADLVLLPGSKNTVKDLIHLRETGMDIALARYARAGRPLIGICGGYQMLGRKILDPHRVESPFESVEGLGFLDATTEITREKTTRRVKARFVTTPPIIEVDPGELDGYEIHLGSTASSKPVLRISRDGMNVDDGASSGWVWGTYLHGIFDNDILRRGLINALRCRRGLEPLNSPVNYRDLRDSAINSWADVIRRHVDIKQVYAMMGLEP